MSPGNYKNATNCQKKNIYSYYERMFILLADGVCVKWYFSELFIRYWRIRFYDLYCIGGMAAKPPIGEIEKTERTRKPSSVCRPNYQRQSWPAGGHLSWPAITGRLSAIAEATYPNLNCAGPTHRFCLVLQRVGFAVPEWLASTAVRSYRTISPLPEKRLRVIQAVYFLWHCPEDRSRWPLAITLPCAARTFLWS